MVVIELLSDEYIQQKSGVFLRKDSVLGLKKIDGVVLDIDGVILDVTESFRVAISRTTQFYFANILSWNGKAILVSPQETQFFKLAGGFNNDWELTYAAVLFFLAKSVQFDNVNLDFLKNRGKLVKDFTKEVAAQGGGLQGAEKVVFSALKREQVEKIVSLWDQAKIKQIFQELYGGVTYCRQLYGFDPELMQEEGLINRERVILNAENLKPFYPKIGILTGRTREEAQVALSAASLDGLISQEALFSDDGGLTKPDPRILRDLGKKISAETGIYMGDTLDDLKTVANFRALGPKARLDIEFFSCIVTRRESERQMFFDLQADIVAEDPNEVLIALSDLKQGG